MFTRPMLAFFERGVDGRLKLSLSMLIHAPARILGTAAVLLAWAVLLVGLFPASVPLSLAVGFWPPALLSARSAEDEILTMLLPMD